MYLGCVYRCPLCSNKFGMCVCVNICAGAVSQYVRVVYAEAATAAAVHRRLG